MNIDKRMELQRKEFDAANDFAKALHEIAFSAEQGLKYGNDARRELRLIQNIVAQALAPKIEDKAVERTLIELRRKMRSFRNSETVPFSAVECWIDTLDGVLSEEAP